MPGCVPVLVHVSVKLDNLLFSFELCKKFVKAIANLIGLPDLLFSFELCVVLTMISALFKLHPSLLFSFELCRISWRGRGVHAAPYATCYFLLNYASTAHLPVISHQLQKLAIFFWIMRMAKRNHKNRTRYTLLFSFELCSPASALALILPLFPRPCYFLLNYARQLACRQLGLTVVALACYFLLNYARPFHSSWRGLWRMGLAIFFWIMLGGPGRTRGGLVEKKLLAIFFWIMR